MEVSSHILSEITTHMKYAKFIPELNRREVWNEVIDRNKAMHLKKYPHLTEEIELAYEYVYRKEVLPSMRSLQFAGKPVELNPARLYNCSFCPMDAPEAFSELMFLLLSGVGVGYSVQSHHVEKLPEIRVSKKTRRYLIGDSIEGWADAIKVLVRSYFEGKPRPIFDYSDIRPKGAVLVTAGGKAPGPEPLKDCVHNVSKIFDRKADGEKLTPLDVHHICCYIADAVLSGGIRRSAMIALFDLTDEEMLTCKYGESINLNPHLHRANNSAVIVRHKIDKSTFLDLWKKIELSNTGEPGFFFTNDKEYGLNPCAEISLKSNQFCNLTTINAMTVKTQDDLNNRARVAAFIGTLQAGYTNFHYLRDIWQTTTEKEALIGVSMTGIASGKVLEMNLTDAAQIVKDENERVAALIGINKAARTTTVKPEGTTSLVLGTSSGIHAWHNDYYIRRLRVGKNEAIYAYLESNHPDLLEDDYFKPKTSAVISVPQKAPANAITRQETALDLLNRVARVWSEWVAPGHRKGSNINNVSATISIKEDEWKLVGEWMWKHRDEFTALSCFPFSDASYVQAPFEDISKSTYYEMLKTLTDVDLTKVVEHSDETALQDSVACGGGACEIV